MPDSESETEQIRQKVKDDAFVVDRDGFSRVHLYFIDVDSAPLEPESSFPGQELPTDKDNIYRLTHGDFEVSDPQWSPDGKQIAYVAEPAAPDSSAKTTIQILAVEIKTVRQLTPDLAGARTALVAGW